MMSDIFENIQNDAIKLNNDGELELSDDLIKAIAGGVSSGEEEDMIGNNCDCDIVVKV